MRTIWRLLSALCLAGALFNYVGSLASAHDSDVARTRSLALVGVALGALALSRTESGKDGGESRG